MFAELKRPLRRRAGRSEPERDRDARNRRARQSRRSITAIGAPLGSPAGRASFPLAVQTSLLGLGSASLERRRRALEHWVRASTRRGRTSRERGLLISPSVGRISAGQSFSRLRRRESRAAARTIGQEKAARRTNDEAQRRLASIAHIARSPTSSLCLTRPASCCTSSCATRPQPALAQPSERRAHARRSSSLVRPLHLLSLHPQQRARLQSSTALEPHPTSTASTRQPWSTSRTSPPSLAASSNSPRRIRLTAYPSRAKLYRRAARPDHSS